MSKNLTNPTSTAAFCLCGCYEETGPKAFYRPGHDARHVSNLLAAIIAEGNLSTANVARYSKALPSEALRFKLERAVDNFAAKGTKAKKARQEAPLEEDDTTGWKIGRWVYPMACRFPADDQGERYDWHYNTKRDGSGEWVSIEGAKGEMIGL